MGAGGSREWAPAEGSSSPARCFELQQGPEAGGLSQAGSNSASRKLQGSVTKKKKKFPSPENGGKQF